MVLQHGVNMNTSLLTFDGFPRSDIDVAQIRTTRARIIRLKNDHKELMVKLEKVVQEHFAAGKAVEAASSVSAPGRAPDGSTAANEAASRSAVEPPFANVNSVSPGSPADRAGLKTGDRISRFGTVNWTNHERLSNVARVVQQNENVGSFFDILRYMNVQVLMFSQRPITVKAVRSTSSSSQPLELRLTPSRDWGGRGLLGCHLVPL